MKAQPPTGLDVDYENGTYMVTLFSDYKLTAYSMTRSVASYAFWLQNQYARADHSPLRNVRRTGWFERPVAWVKGLINIMALSADEINEEMARLTAENLWRGTTVKTQSLSLDISGWSGN